MLVLVLASFVVARMAHAGAQIAVVRVDAGQKARELGEGHLVHTTLELDHGIERHPIVIPAPGVEFRMVGGAQIHVTVATHQAQQEPDLLLPAIDAARVFADEVLWHLVAQPVARAPDDLYMLDEQPHFFVQLAEHGLLGRLAVLDAALRELPRVRAQPFAPENLVAAIEQDDADVGPEAFPVEHNQTPIL